MEACRSATLRKTPRRRALLSRWRTVLARQPLTISDRDIDDALLNIQPLVDLHGRVAIEGEQQTNFSALPGTPSPSVTMHVTLSPLNGPMPSGVGTGITNDGSFTLSGIASGAYKVRVSGIPGGTLVKSIRLGAIEARDCGIEVVGATTAPLEITLSRSVGQISGIVETDQGKPAAFSSITLVDDPPGPGLYLTGTVEDGQFTLASVPPGAYRIYAWEDIENAHRYDPAFLKAYENKGTRVIGKENGREQITLKQIPTAPELIQ